MASGCADWKKSIKMGFETNTSLKSNTGPLTLSSSLCQAQAGSIFADIMMHCHYPDHAVSMCYVSLWSDPAVAALQSTISLISSSI